MTTSPYTPTPIDTSSVELSDELKKLVEHLARNIPASSNMTNSRRTRKTTTVTPPWKR